MSRSLSTAGYTHINSQESGGSDAMLLTIENSDGPPLRLTTNSEDIVSRSKTFISYPFALELPSDQSGAISEARISIDNVARALVDEVRNLSDPLVMTLELVMVATPDTVEMSFSDYLLRNTNIDELSISGTLTQENYVTERYPKDIISGMHFTGIL